MPSKKSYRKKKDSVDKRLKALERERQKIDIKSKVKTKNEISFNTNTSTIPNFDMLNIISRGTDDSQMIGSSIVLRSISWKFLLHSNTTNKAQIIRYAIIRLNTNTNFTNEGEKLFKDTSGNSKDYADCTEQEKFFLPLNRDTMDVVATDIVKLGAKNIDQTDQFNCNQIVSGYKKYKGIKLDYSANETPVVQYYFLMWSMLAGMDTSISSWGTTEVTGRVKFNFTDE